MKTGEPECETSASVAVSRGSKASGGWTQRKTSEPTAPLDWRRGDVFSDRMGSGVGATVSPRPRAPCLRNAEEGAACLSLGNRRKATDRRFKSAWMHPPSIPVSIREHSSGNRTSSLHHTASTIKHTAPKCKWQVCTLECKALPAALENCEFYIWTHCYRSCI